MRAVIKKITNIPNVGKQKLLRFPFSSGVGMSRGGSAGAAGNSAMIFGGLLLLGGGYFLMFQEEDEE